jgi:hypothetical protein
MVPRKESDVRLLEDDIGQYGPILYENSQHFNEMNVKKNKAGAVAIGVMGVLMFLFPFIGEPASPIVWIFAIIIGPMFLIIAYIGSKQIGGEFRLLERGIRFSFHKIPFIPFEEIDHIEKREGIKHNTPFTHIETQDGKSYYIASGSMKYVNEIPENYNGFLRTLEKRLLETHPNENPGKLIRDVYNIPWESDALEELDKHKFSRRTIMVKVNDKVLEEGRFRVTLGDYIRYK